jgi:hypothetical protein
MFVNVFDPMFFRPNVSVRDVPVAPVPLRPGASGEKKSPASDFHSSVETERRARFSYDGLLALFSFE